MADLSAVLEVLRQRHEADLQAWGCAALRNLTEEGGADFRQKALEHGALELVLDALERHPAVPQLQECGLAALSGFAKGESYDAATGSQGLRLAMKAVKEHFAREEVCRWAFSALSELLRCEKMAEELGKYSFLDLISFAMQRHPHAAQVQACGLAFLGRFCLKSDASSVAAVDKAARGLVFNAMEAHPGAVEVQACGSSAIGAFVLRGGHQRSMAQSCAPQLLLEAMRQHGSNATVQEKAANALRLVGSEDSNVALRLGAAEVLVSALRLHTAERVLSACLATLHSLTAERGTAMAFGFVVLAPKTPRECDAELLMQILRRYPDSSSILDPALALLWGQDLEDSDVAVHAVHLAAGALDAAAPKTLTLAAAVLSRAGAAGPAVPGKVAKQLLRVIKLHPQNRMLQERAWEALLTVLRLTNGADATLDMASMLRNLVETMKRHPGPVQRIGCDIMTLCCLPNEETLETSTACREQLLELEAPQVIADAMQKNLEVVELQDSACASLQCLAMADTASASALQGTEEALLRALEAQPNSQDVQIRSLDLLSAFARNAGRGASGTSKRLVLLPAVPLALRALRSYGQESAGLAEVSVRLLLRMLDDSDAEGPEPMEGIARRVLDFLDEGPSLATRTVLRSLARESHDVCTRLLALNGVPPAAEAAAPPLLTLQLLTQLALRRAARDALRRCAALKRKALEALRLEELDTGSAESRDALTACSCCLWSRLAADGPAAAQQLVADGEGAPEVLELLLEQLQVSADRSLHAWCFLTLQNLCGSTPDAHERRQQLLQRGLLRLVAAAAQSAASGAAVGAASTQRLETILMICLHSLGSSCDPNDQDLLSEEVLSMLIRGLGTSWALEVRERACFLLCYLANSNEKVKDTLLAGGASLWKSLLEVLKDHLAEVSVDGNDGSEDEEILLELALPDVEGSDDATAPLRALQLREAELLLEAMQALPFEARVQVTACSSLRRLALLAMSSLASRDTGRVSSAQCLALVQRLPRGMANTVQAMKQHERSDEVQRAAVLALQALTRLCSSLEGEDVAIQRLVDLESVPILARALRNYPQDPQMQERGLDVLRLLSTRLETVTEQLCQLAGDGGSSFVPAIVEAMNLNISKPKIQEYGLSLLAEVGWQGAEQQRVVLTTLGVEAVVRALKAFPQSGDVQTVGLAAVQAITSGNEECRLKFFSLCEILEIVLQAMGNFPLLEGVQAFGCAALISLVHSKSERIGALADLNGASMAESAMVGHPKSQRVLEFAEHLMEIMRKG